MVWPTLLCNELLYGMAYTAMLCAAIWYGLYCCYELLYGMAYNAMF